MMMDTRFWHVIRLRVSIFLFAIGFIINSSWPYQSWADPPTEKSISANLSAIKPLSPIINQSTPSPQKPTPVSSTVTPKSSDSLQATPSTSLLQSCWATMQMRNPNDTNNNFGSPPTYKSTKSIIEPQKPLPSGWAGSIRSVKPYHSEKLIALTFDLCEAANEKSGYDASIINYLRDHRIKATLFVGGKWMRSHPEKTMQLMADPLFEIGNHSWSHANLGVLSGSRLYDQITWAQAEYQYWRNQLLKSDCAIKLGDTAIAQTQPAPTLFRFPYGTCNAEALTAVNQAGLVAIQWNIVSGDPAKGQTAKYIARTILNQAQPGAIIVAHANGRGWHTAEALPIIFSELTQRGYQFVTVSELLAKGEIVSANSCYEMKPGDNLRYNRLSKTVRNK